MVYRNNFKIGLVTHGRGNLRNRSNAGFSYANLRNGVTTANWNYALCFYMSDGTK